MSRGGDTGSRPNLAQLLVLAPIELYRRLVSPLKPVPSCRFHPTCSSYAHQAVREHGAFRGSLLAVRRILRCHPYHPGGFDPVPPRRTLLPAARTTRRAP